MAPKEIMGGDDEWSEVGSEEEGVIAFEDANEEPPTEDSVSQPTRDVDAAATGMTTAMSTFWFWRADGGSWHPFDDPDAAALESALASGEDCAVLGRDGGSATYVVDLTAAPMTQRNLDTGFVRDVRRGWPEEGEEEEDGPGGAGGEEEAEASAGAAQPETAESTAEGTGRTPGSFAVEGGNEADAAEVAAGDKPDAAAPAPPEAAACDAAPKQDTGADDPVIDSARAEEGAGLGDEPDAEAPRPANEGAVSDGAVSASARAASTDPLPDSKFYEGDKAMYVPPRKGEESAASSAVAKDAIKVRVVSIDPPYYRIVLPNGTETEVHFTILENGSLFTVDEYENMAQEAEALKHWNFVPTESYGGTGGEAFDDFPNRWRHIDELSLNTGALVDGVRLLYSDGSVSEHGGKGGGWKSFALGGGEYVTEAEVRYGRYVQSLAFGTNRGRKLGPCGAGGFFLGMGRVKEVRLEAPPRHMLAGIHGRRGKYMDAIGFYWAPVTAAAEAVTKQDLSTQLKKKLLKSTECYGGPGGGPFDDGHYNIRINEINVRTGTKGTVKGITVWYFNGKVASYGRKQRDDDHGEYLSLELGEFINEVRVHYGQYVEGLTFKTTRGRELVCDAGATDKDDTEMAVAKAPEGYMLVGIKGGSGARIDRIGFHWGPAPNGSEE